MADEDSLEQEPEEGFAEEFFRENKKIIIFSCYTLLFSALDIGLLFFGITGAIPMTGEIVALLLVLLFPAIIFLLGIFLYFYGEILFFLVWLIFYPIEKLIDYYKQLSDYSKKDRE